MLKNCVFKSNVDTKVWLENAGIRAIKTVAQSIIGGVGVAVSMEQVDWKYIISAAILAGIISILTSIVGLPEVESVNIDTEDLKDTEYNEVEDVLEKEEGDK
mgnify:CR=1 FL=1